MQDELERDLEKEVVRQLHEENLRLKQKLQEMEEKERTYGSGWNEVTAGGGTPPPPRDGRPMERRFQVDHLQVM